MLTSSKRKGVSLHPVKQPVCGPLSVLLFLEDSLEAIRVNRLLSVFFRDPSASSSEKDETLTCIYLHHLKNQSEVKHYANATDVTEQEPLSTAFSITWTHLLKSKPFQSKLGSEKLCLVKDYRWQILPVSLKSKYSRLEIPPVMHNLK